MSLVAAYSDSEDDDENEQENIPAETNTETVDDDKTNEQIFDEDLWESNVQFQNSIETTKDKDNILFANLPVPKQSEGNKFIDDNEDLEDEFLAKKPTLVSRSPTVTTDTNDTKNIDDQNSKSEDDEGKSEMTSNKRSFLNLPKPSKSKGKVRISLPSLQTAEDSDNSDNDEDERQTQADISKKSISRSSLFSRLPKPKHSVTVCSNKNRVFQKETNRDLIPHTLRKQENKQKKKPAVQKPTKGKNESDSDDDVDITAGNFFSFNEEKKRDKDDKLEKNLSEIPKTLSKDIPTVAKVTSPETDSKPTVREEGNSSKGNAYFAALMGAGKSKTVDKSINKKQEPVKPITSISPAITSSSNIASKSPFSNTQSRNTASNTSTHYGDNKTSETFPVERSIPLNTISTGNIGSSSTSHTKNSTSSPVPYLSNNNTRNTGADHQISEINNSSVTAPYGHSSVTKSYGDSSVTAPYGTSSVTAPYGDSSVTAPYGGSSVTAQYGDSTGQYSSQPNLDDQGLYMYTDHSSNVSQSSSEQDTGRFFQYAYENNSNQEEIDYYNQPNQDLPLDEQAIVALKGKGKKRQKEEINIIDVNAASLQMNNEEYLKNLSTQPTYRPKKPKSELPSSKQKRKHQITYLAFQARAREQELQQSWAESRQTRQQTQSKYGF